MFRIWRCQRPPNGQKDGIYSPQFQPLICHFNWYWTGCNSKINFSPLKVAWYVLPFDPLSCVLTLSSCSQLVAVLRIYTMYGKQGVFYNHYACRDRNLFQS